MSKIKIADSIMGSGKTSAAINMINGSPPGRKYLIVTPYLSEVQRFIHSCPGKKFREPKNDTTSKRVSIQYLLRYGHNVVTTHALFSDFNDQILEALEGQDYTLVIDEAPVLQVSLQMSRSDVCMLIKGNNPVAYDESTHLLTWVDDEYNGKFNAERELFKNWDLYYLEGSIQQIAKPRVFAPYKEIYILTYQFQSQIQRYCLDYAKQDYEYVSVEGDNFDNYHFVPDRAYFGNGEDYKNLVNICYNKKMNKVGDARTSLSKGWYTRNVSVRSMTTDGKAISKNCTNYSRNIMKASSEDTMWTTFKQFQSLVSPRGCAKGFVSLNARAQNTYRNKNVLMYTVNRFVNPMVVKMFSQMGTPINQDAFALAELLQWMFRSAIRDGEPIDIYIPSSRMRGLLEGWLNGEEVAHDSPNYDSAYEDYDFSEDDFGLIDD